MENGKEEEKKLADNPGFNGIDRDFARDYCKRLTQIRDELGSCPDMIVVSKESIEALLNATHNDTKLELKNAKRKRAYKIGRTLLVVGITGLALFKPDLIRQLIESVSTSDLQIALGILSMGCISFGSTAKTDDEQRIFNDSQIMFDRIKGLFESRKNENEIKVNEGIKK